ncbi:DUF362 domain-containing protein [Tundrisphaera lichenicola]|uniref:DUF362 domain-containing protein n=1 Tax=Tundrisphaera lichenicola TaxID=2029860 RepID=UPI003EBDB2B3
MNRQSTVAVVRSDNRRGAVAQALALIAGDLRERVTPEVLIKTNGVSHLRQLPSTHANTLSASLDAMFAAGASRAIVAEGATDASAGFDRFGFRREACGRPVEFFDINHDESSWGDLGLSAVDGARLTARVSRTVTSAACRVSLALMKTHVTSMVTFSLKNMLSSIHPDDRVMMHGHAGGSNGYRGWKRLVVEFLKGDSFLVNALTRSMGRVRNLKFALSAKNGPEGWSRLSPAEVGYLRSVEAMNRNLVALSRVAKPHVSIVDGFVAMHREGPRHGTPIRLGTVVAGVDAVAVDAVSAAIMGFDPSRIGYLRYAHEAGLGVADLGSIAIVGDTLTSVSRRCVPHSNHAIQRHWDRLPGLAKAPQGGPAIPAPHSSISKAARR